MIKKNIVRKRNSSSEIDHGDDDVRDSDVPFGLAYDIDNLPKISMVHTIDRLPEKYDKRSTVIDIYSEGAFLPGVLLSSEQPRQPLSHEPITISSSEEALQSIGCSARGLLHEATCNSKHVVQKPHKKLSIEKEDLFRGSKRVDCNLRGAKKRKYQRHRMLHYTKTVPLGPEKSEKFDYIGSKLCVNGRACRYDENARGHDKVFKSRIIENISTESDNRLLSNCRPLSDSECFYEPEAYMDDHENSDRFFTQDDHCSVHVKNREESETHLDAVVKIEFNSDSESDSEWHNGYSFHSSSVRADQLVYSSDNFTKRPLELLKGEGKFPRFTDRINEPNNFYTSYVM